MKQSPVSRRAYIRQSFHRICCKRDLCRVADSAEGSTAAQAACRLERCSEIVQVPRSRSQVDMVQGNIRNWSASTKADSFQAAMQARMYGLRRNILPAHDQWGNTIAR